MGMYIANAKRTKKSVAFAFIELLKKQRFEKISVETILKKAEINRSTFYKYFLDKYDLARYAIHQIMDNYIELIEGPKCGETQAYFAEIYDFLTKNKHHLRALLTIKTAELDAFTEIINILKSAYKRTENVSVAVAEVSAYYFADIHYVPMYLFISDENFARSPEEYGRLIGDSIKNMHALFNKITGTPTDGISTDKMGTPPPELVKKCKSILSYPADRAFRSVFYCPFPY